MAEELQHCTYEHKCDDYEDYCCFRFPCPAHKCKDDTRSRNKQISMISPEARGKHQIATYSYLSSLAASKRISFYELVDILMDQARRSSLTCQWSEDEDGNWDTECGNKEILDGGPEEHHHKYCPYCGNKISQHNWVYSDTE